MQSCLEIHLTNLKQNYQYYASHTKKQIIAIVKDNAYGHGLVACAKALAEVGCAAFGVSSILEGKALREHQIKGKILVLGYLETEEYEEAVKQDLSIAIYSKRQLEEIKRLPFTGTLKAHLKINTGMQRNGIEVEDATYIKNLIESDPRILLEGIFTHYIGGVKLQDFVHQQYEQFQKAIACFSLDRLLIHASSSNSFTMMNEDHTNAVRIGLGLYGIGHPNGKPVLKWYAPIVQIYHLRKGTPCGYDGAYRMVEDGYLFTLPVGYSSGMRRITNHIVYIDSYLKQGAKVSMDYSSFVSPCEYPIGKMVELIGEHIPLEEVANRANTIPYDIVCSIPPKVKRIYIE